MGHAARRLSGKNQCAKRKLQLDIALLGVNSRNLETLGKAALFEKGDPDLLAFRVDPT
jgi:hypothetical protein